MLKTSSRLIACLLAAAPAWAGDMTFTPAAGGGVVIHAAPGAPALAVLPTGEVRLPGLPATPAAATSVVCHDAAGTLGRCDPLVAVGPKGDAGAAGATGPQGPAGADGAPGAAGAIGPAGPKGDAGATGATGPKGDAGAAGPKGDAGAAGPMGPIGPQGVPGQAGPKGDAGEKGDTGAQGPAGPAGPQGAVAGVAVLRHGCFTVRNPIAYPLGPATLVSGANYTVTPGTDGAYPGYVIQFDTPPGGLDSTVLLEVRGNNTGRRFAATVQRDYVTDLIVVLKEQPPGGEDLSVCFVLMR